MDRTFGTAPSLEEIEAIARAALERLPAQFRAHLGDVVLRVEDFADEETLAALGIEDPFELTGIYEGLPLGEKSVGAFGRHARPHPPVPLADPRRMDRARGRDLEHLVTHVLVHEVGHHFGLSDDDMHALEEAAQ